MMRILPLVAAVCVLAAPVFVAMPVYADEVEVTLKGSRASMLRQNRIAREESYSFLRTPTQVLGWVDNGHLVRLEGSADYGVIAGYPYARPVVRSFIERLSADYRAACGEKLIVTSLMRPSTRQPRNASPLSVHPAGMAVDLRVSARASCRDWLSGELLALETRGVIDATREHNPPHFHVAVFPSPYQRFDQTLEAMAAAEEANRLLDEAIAQRLADEEALEPAELVEASAQPSVSVPPLRPHLLVRLSFLMARLVLPLPV